MKQRIVPQIHMGCRAPVRRRRCRWRWDVDLEVAPTTREATLDVDLEVVTLRRRRRRLLEEDEATEMWWWRRP